MNSQLTKRRNPFEKPIQTDTEETNEDSKQQKESTHVAEVEEVLLENEPQTIQQANNINYVSQQQPQYQQPTQYYDVKPAPKVRNNAQKVVTRDTRQYYAATNEISRDKFTSTMETNLRRSIKIVCAQRGIMFAQFVEEACREKLQREGIR